MRSTREDEQWIIQLSDEQWLSEVNDELNQLQQIRSEESQRWEKHSIYEIPWRVKELNSSAYRPQTVWIGPYHHGKQHLKAMEEHKHRALRTFLDRSKKPLQCYVDALAPVVEDLKAAYHQLHPKWKQDSKAFLKLMILDGCFILEFMRTATTTTPEGLGYARNDPVFGNHGKIYFARSLRRDMIMLENQLPLVVLLKLLVAEDGALTADGLSKQDKLTALILEFYLCWHNKRSIKRYETCLHILDMYRKSLLTTVPWHKSRAKARNDHCFPSLCKKENYVPLLSAIELSEAGIRFERSKTGNLNDISFRGGVLKLPPITVDETLEPEFLNLMAFERLHVNAGNEVTSYVFFMSNIINSARDVSLLHSSWIIRNALGSDDAAVNLFTLLMRDVDLDPEGSLWVVQEQILDYYRMKLPHWIAHTKRNYLARPRLFILAAIFLYALTAIQTVYTVVGFYRGDVKR